MKEYIVKIDHNHTEGMTELIRCKDCIFSERSWIVSTKPLFCNKVGQKVDYDHYCGYGVQKDAEA